MEKRLHQEIWNKIRDNKLYEYDRKMKEYMEQQRQKRKDDEQKYRCHPECVFM